MHLHHKMRGAVLYDIDAFIDRGQPTRKPHIDHGAVNGGDETWIFSEFHELATTPR